MNKEIAKLADSMGIKGHEFNTIYELYIQNKKEEAIQFVIEKTNCNNSTAINIVNGLMKDMPIPTPQEQAHNNAVARELLNKPKCPTCGSTNVKPISTTERAASVIGLGLLSKKINKTYKCLNCKCTW